MQVPTFGGGLRDAQEVVIKNVTKAIGQSVVDWDADTPKMKRAEMNLGRFENMCRALSFGVPWFEMLQRAHSESLGTVVAFAKLRKRFLEDMEDGLLRTFLAACECNSWDINKLNFPSSDPASEFASVQSKLAETTELISEEKRKTADAARLAAVADDAKILAETPTRTEGEEGAKLLEGALGSAAGNPEAAIVEEKVCPAKEDGKAAICIDAAVASRFALAQSVMNDVFCIWDSPPAAKNAPRPATVATSGVLYIVPSDPQSRGKKHPIGGIRLGTGTQALQWAGSGDAVMIGLVHEPSLVQKVTVDLGNVYPELKKFQWQPLVPVVQNGARATAAGSNPVYVEYYLIGLGVHWKGSKEKG